MVTVTVTFDIPPGKSAAEIVETFSAGTDKWRECDGLLRKYYLVSPDGARAGGVYLWRSRADADAVIHEGFAERIERKYGSAPTIERFDTPIVIDNVAGTLESAAK